MKCPKCKSENTDTARFCSNCATQLRPGGQPPPAFTKTLESPAHILGKGSIVAGKYRITEEIGRGGMGVVYEAEDTKLARKVAIKVLPEVFTQDPERLARFEREARVLASLNHPNIAAIYGVEEAEGKRFLVLELVEGENLDERLRQGPLNLEDSLEICRQIAEGLEGAHEKGIVHRDLKPSNVKITPERKVKILDFGLAKALHDQVSGIDISKSPTITADMTEPGVILGTAAYMSPEQATGRPVDKRADIWAFGCILYECLTGKRAFPGDTVTENLAAVLRGEPDWDSLPADMPVSARTVLRRCLQKDPVRRLRDIGDARLEIEAPIIHPSEAVSAPRRISLPGLAALIGVAVLAGILVSRLVIWRPRSVTSPLVVTSTIKVEPGLRLYGYSCPELQQPHRTALAISSDGKFVVYCAVEQNTQAKGRLFLRRMDESEAKPIPGTETGQSPFLSPDNRWVGFFAEPSTLKKIPIEGGVPSPLCDISTPFGASWGPDNSIAFSDGMTAGLSRVSAQGGKPEMLTKPDPKREEYCHRLPSWLPNGKAILFTVMRYAFDYQPSIAQFRLDTREWRVLLQDAADARYVPTGHLVFLRQGTLMAVGFDLGKMEVIGQPFPLVEDVMQAFYPGGWLNSGAGQYSVSNTGSLIYASGGIFPDLNNLLMWVDHQGQEQPVTDLKFPYFAPRLSPDGQRIAYLTVGREANVYVYDIGRGTNSRLTGEGAAAEPIWSPDGKKLLFGWKRSLATNLFWQPSDGSLPMERLTTSEYEQFAGSWSPDGKTVALQEDCYPNSDISLLDVRSGRIAPFLNSPFGERQPDFSPDGRWIAYTSDETNGEEVYVRAFPGPGLKQQVSSEGGFDPVWSKNGKQLFYRFYDGQVWVVDVRTEAGFAASKPRLLFKKPGYDVGWMRTFDISPDGHRFLMVKLEEIKPRPVTEMILVQNWLEELKRRAPAGK